jgi:hypothetical protein
MQVSMCTLCWLPVLLHAAAHDASCGTELVEGLLVRMLGGALVTTVLKQTIWCDGLGMITII